MLESITGAQSLDLVERLWFGSVPEHELTSEERDEAYKLVRRGVAYRLGYGSIKHPFVLELSAQWRDLISNVDTVRGSLYETYGPGYGMVGPDAEDQPVSPEAAADLRSQACGVFAHVPRVRLALNLMVRPATLTSLEYQSQSRDDLRVLEGSGYAVAVRPPADDPGRLYVRPDPLPCLVDLALFFATRYQPDARHFTTPRIDHTIVDLLGVVQAQLQSERQGEWLSEATVKAAVWPLLIALTPSPGNNLPDVWSEAMGTIADPTSQRILTMITEESRDWGFLAAVIGVNPAQVSKWLGHLAARGLVKRQRRETGHVLYLHSRAPVTGGLIQILDRLAAPTRHAVLTGYSLQAVIALLADPIRQRILGQLLTAEDGLPAKVLSDGPDPSRALRSLGAAGLVRMRGHSRLATWEPGLEDNDRPALENILVHENGPEVRSPDPTHLLWNLNEPWAQRVVVDFLQAAPDTWLSEEELANAYGVAIPEPPARPFRRFLNAMMSEGILRRIRERKPHDGARYTVSEATREAETALLRIHAAIGSPPLTTVAIQLCNRLSVKSKAWTALALATALSPVSPHEIQELGSSSHKDRLWTGRLGSRTTGHIAHRHSHFQLPSDVGSSVAAVFQAIARHTPGAEPAIALLEPLKRSGDGETAAALAGMVAALNGPLGEMARDVLSVLGSKESRLDMLFEAGGRPDTTSWARMVGGGYSARTRHDAIRSLWERGLADEMGRLTDFGADVEHALYGLAQVVSGHIVRLGPAEAVCRLLDGLTNPLRQDMLRLLLEAGPLTSESMDITLDAAGRVGQELLVLRQLNLVRAVIGGGRYWSYEVNEGAATELRAVLALDCPLGYRRGPAVNWTPQAPQVNVTPWEVT